MVHDSTIHFLTNRCQFKVKIIWNTNIMGRFWFWILHLLSRKSDCTVQAAQQILLQFHLNHRTLVATGTSYRENHIEASLISMPHYKVSLCPYWYMDTAVVVEVFSWPTEKVSILLTRSGVQSMWARMSVEEELWWGGGGYRCWWWPGLFRWGCCWVLCQRAWCCSWWDVMRGQFQGGSRCRM